MEPPFTHEGTDGDDDITGTDFNDRIRTFGGKDVIRAGGGIDVIYGGEGDDTLYGEDGSDFLYGGPGNDKSYGGFGNDYFEDAEGVDESYGEEGLDTFVITSADGDLFDGGPGADAIYILLSDLASPGVTIDLSALWTGGTGYVGSSRIVNVETMPYTLYGTHGADTIIIGKNFSGFAYVVAEGGDDSVTGGSGANNLHGEGGNDTLVGDAMNDFLDGGSGNDTLIGDVGDDYLAGGSGDDFLQADSGADVLRGDDGDDTLFGGTGADLVDGGAGSDVLYGGDGDDLLLGGADDDELHGGNDSDFLDGGLGDDAIFGDAGSDTIRTSPGIDTIDAGADDDNLTVLHATGGSAEGGAGTDKLTIDLRGTSSAGVTVIDLSQLWTAGTAAIGGLSITGFETVAYASYATEGADLVQFGSPAGSSLRFNAGGGNDTVNGGAGNDLLWGEGGNDTIDGGAGLDYMVGGYGDDTYFVTDAGDTVMEQEGEGTDTVYASTATHQLRPNVEILIGTSTGGQTLLGNLGNETIEGNSGNDTINGFAGDDTMKGGAGNDGYYVYDAGDVVVENPGEGTDTVYTYVSHTLEANVENLTLLNAGQVGTGNGLANTIYGSSGIDTIFGLGGADQIASGGGADTIDAGDGDDLVWGGAGNDVIRGGLGFDRLRGEAGADRFVFGEGETSAVRASADRLLDFSQGDGDRIDLSGIDANAGVAGDQAFAFIGSAAFSNVAGQLRFEQSGGYTYVEGDTNGDAIADFSIQLGSILTPTVADFVL